MTQNKGFASIALIIITLLVLGGGYWVWQNQLGSPTSKSAPAPVTDTNIEPPTPKENTGCTEDAKLCPDGSVVVRVAPKCEFAPCPGL